VVKIAREGYKSRLQVKLFFASTRSSLLVKFVLPQGKPSFYMDKSASKQPILCLICKPIVAKADFIYQFPRLERGNAYFEVGDP
jgi:hypothetical protein